MSSFFIEDGYGQATVASFVGPTGPTGPAGAQGATGPTGTGIGINETPASKTSSFTFSLSEANRTTIVDSSSAVEGLIPTNASVAYPVGTKLRMFRKGTGSVKFVPDTGVTLRLPTGIAPRRFMGVMARHAGATAQNWTVATSVPFAAADAYDTDGFHDPAVNNTRLTIPTGLGIKKITLSAAIQAVNLANNWASLGWISSVSGSFGFINHESTGGVMQMVNTNPLVACIDGEYFNATVRVQTDTSIDVQAATSFGLIVTEIDAQGFVAYQYGAVEIEKIATDEWIVTDHSALG